ncbi:MAG TPA: helix-turn-helix domain-containing protein, partial [Spirochaetia bacterium]|nr:helix-turn-helix domain-containing protein [Spirochaetia bacterium]
MRNLRKERDLRQKDLAAVLGLAQTTIANYEQNTRFPDEETLKKIVNYFNTSLDFLLGRSDLAHGSPAAGGSEAEPLQERSTLVLSPLARAYLDALLAGDKRKAMQLVLDECERGRGVNEIYAEVFQPVLEEVGYRWEVAQADVYEEHFVSSVTVNLMAQVMQYAPPSDAKRGVFLSVVCGGEQHEIGLRMVNDFLEIAGWEAVYLGTNVPSRNIIKAVEDRKAD